MSIYVGNTKIGKMYLGSTEIADAYLGSSKVYSSIHLPYDAQVEYLQSSGTQKIAAGITGIATIIGSAQVTTVNNLSQLVISSSNGNAGTWYGGNTSSKWGAGAASGTYTNIDVTTRGDFNLIFTNSEVIGTVNGESIYRTHSSTQGEWYLFRCQNNSNAFIGKLYYIKIYQNNTLVRDFIPVRVGQVGYMYDQVSGQLFGNAGSGSFVLGNDV